MKEQVAAAIEAAVRSIAEARGGEAPEFRVVLTRPDEAFGDFATNVALQLAGRLGMNPKELAEQVADRLTGTDAAQSATVAGPGFLNITLSDSALVSLVQPAITLDTLAGKTVVAEYSDPNPFKVLHAGHFYTSVVGNAIANLLELSGATVHRVNFGGDVGLHAAKTMWAIMQRLGGEEPQRLDSIPEADRSDWMAAAYVEGTAAYEDDEAAKAEITALNTRLYGLHATNDHESPLAVIYWRCREWSYKYFETFYERINTKFERFYPESEVAGLGLATVKEQLAAGVFSESNGAVVFEGEKFGLHTRVFINSEGLPTYEAKDVGLIMTKYNDYHFDKSVVITGSEQEQYMSVVLKAVEQFRPELVYATTHLTHGLVKLQGGVKMSSRKGNFLRAVDVLDAAAKANEALNGKDDQNVVLGATKYAFLKQRMGPDIIYDPDESVSLQGNSGPYLQYAHARARSILRKAPGDMTGASAGISGGAGAGLEVLSAEPLQPGERSLVRCLGEFGEVVSQAAEELMPHYICTYLYSLSQVFNRFYENNRVIGDERQAVRLALVGAYADTLRHGLTVLGIPAPDSM